MCGEETFHKTLEEAKKQVKYLVRQHYNDDPDSSEEDVNKHPFVIYKLISHVEVKKQEIEIEFKQVK